MKVMRTLALSMLLCSGMAQAKLAINFGPIYVGPNESSGNLNVVEAVAGLPSGSTEVAVNGNTQLGITFDWAFSDQWTLEVVAATPFSHDISVSGSAIDGLQIGETKHLPPTVLMQYHFGAADAKLRPFVGAGLNYTTFFEEKADAQLIGALTSLGVMGAGDDLSLHLDDSFGIALQAGFNYRVNQTWDLHGMLMWADIDTDAEVRLNGTNIQPVTVEIDPTIAFVAARYRF